MKEEFEYKVIDRHSDEKYFHDLLENAAFIHNRKQDSIEWLKWKYFGSPYGDCIVVLAYSKSGKLAGEISFGKYEFVQETKVVKAMYSYQTMVHPDFQKMGLFTSLTKIAIEIGTEQGIDIIFNFPNQNSYKPFLKLNFIPVNGLKYWVAPGNLKMFMREFSPLAIKKPFQVNRIGSYSNEVLDKFERLARNVKVPVAKDKLYPNRTYEFLKWRYFTYPMHEYAIVESTKGWAIVRLGVRGGIKEVQIMELFAFNNLNGRCLRSVVKAIRRELKVGLIVFNMSQAHPLNKSMFSSGFISLPNKLKFCVYPLNETGQSYTDSSCWIITATEFHRY